MNIRPLALPEVLLVEPRIFEDDRGFFYESFHAERFAEAGLPTRWLQDNHSRSRRNVVRGLHYQLGRPQGKYITVVQGEVLDVAVDIRVGSPTFGRWCAERLSADRPRYLYIPTGFAHGFCVLSETADLLYKCTDVYVPSEDRCVRWDDPAIGIDWPVTTPIVSAKDRAAPTLDEARSYLPAYPEPHAALK